jgi:AraC-like DNA-binding protein
MSKVETLEELYKNHWLPEGLRSGIGHFNVLRLEPIISNNPSPPPYRRRDYYKISLLTGNCIMHYADKVTEIKKQALVFTNPLVPYGWKQNQNTPGGFTCIFDQKFFHRFGELNHYAVFQNKGIPVFELSDEQFTRAAFLYELMLEEIDSDYIYKYDLLRGLVFELLHFALKMYPNNNLYKQSATATRRISTQFLDLLERQFPIDDIRQNLTLRSATDYAQRLNVHVNYLNRAVKDVTGQTTTQLITQRVLQEAKMLLKNTAWNVSEVAYALGFSEPAHFNNFFKKHLKLNPLKFRKV